MGDDVVDLAAGDRTPDEIPGSRASAPPTAELRGDFVADLDGSVDPWGGESTRADQAPGRRVDEELHRPGPICVGRVLEVLEGEADRLRKLGPAVRHG